MGITMKKTLFIIILLISSFSCFSQENRSVRMRDLTDSLNVIRAAIAAIVDGSSTNLDTTYIYQAINSKQPAMGSNDNYVTDAEKIVIGNTSGTNSGNNAVNTLYSGLAASKQDALISGTNIRTVNGNSLLGSGNIAIAAGVDTNVVVDIVEQFMIDSSYTSIYSGDSTDALLTLAATALQDVAITYPDANTISFGDNVAIQLDPATLEINGTDQLSVIGGAGADSGDVAGWGFITLDDVPEGNLTSAQVTQIGMTWTYLALDTTATITDGFSPSTTDATVSTLYYSLISSVSANDVVRVSVDSAQYRVYTNGGWSSWTGTARFYKDVDSAQVRHYSSASNSTETTQNLTIGNSTEEFSVTTVASAPSCDGGLITDGASCFSVDSSAYWTSVGSATKSWSSDSLYLTVTSVGNDPWGIQKADLVDELTTYILTFRAKSSNISARSINLGAATINSSTNPNLTTTFQNYTFDLTTASEQFTLQLRIDDQNAVGTQYVIDDIKIIVKP